MGLMGVSAPSLHIESTDSMIEAIMTECVLLLLLAFDAKRATTVRADNVIVVPPLYCLPVQRRNT